MQMNQKVIEIVGKPGKVWGQVMVPTTGTIEVRIVGDLVQATVKNGFEKTTSWTRIQNVDSIEIAEAPNYLLLAIGVPISLMSLASFESNAVLGFVILAIGVLFIVFAFREKRRLLAIHSLRYTVPVFMTKSSDLYQQFAANVMAIARQLNAPMPASQPNRPAQIRPTNSATPRSAKVE